jgi:predicted outer membrane lipoprotein
MWYWITGVLSFCAGVLITTIIYETWGRESHYVQNKVALDGTVYPAGQWVEK